MNWFCHSAMLFAVEGAYKHMGRRFRRGNSGAGTDDFLFMLMIVGAIVFAIWAGSQLFALWQRRQQASPGGLFRELCRAHGLNWRSRRLLRQLTRWHRLNNPASVFLEPKRFEANRLNSALTQRRREIESLKNALFLDARGRAGPGAAKG